MNKKYQSEQLMVCHESAQALYEIGAITEAQMQEFDRDCLVSEPSTPSVATGGHTPGASPVYAHPRR
jgi:DNA-binding transcriptional regulator YiaG